jgi:hypothetical protein
MLNEVKHLTEIAMIGRTQIMVSEPFVCYFFALRGGKITYKRCFISFHMTARFVGGKDA